MKKNIIIAVCIVMIPSVCVGFTGERKLRPLAEKPIARQSGLSADNTAVDTKENKAAKKKPDFYGIALASASQPAGPPVLSKVRAG